MTQQHFKADCDVNRIVSLHVKSGTPLPPINPDDFIDVSGLSDYRDCIHRINQADSDFMSLPSSTRKAFFNDPAEFLMFISSEKTPEHVALGVELGIYDYHPQTGETRTSMAQSEEAKAEPASKAS